MKFSEPYRIFFPAGWLLGFTGVSLWIPWLLGFPFIYPGISHPSFMISGFLFCYAMGFLTTAIPRFTGTQRMTPGELQFAIPLLLLLLFSILSFQPILARLTNLGIILFFILFARKRFMIRSANLPPSFIFVGIAIFSAILGLSLFLLIDFHLLEPEYLGVAKSALYTNFLLALVMGIGSKLIPALLGHTPVPIPLNPGISNAPALAAAFWKNIPIEFRILPILFLIALALEFSPSTIIFARIIRLGIFSFVAVRFWRIIELPPARGYFTTFIWLSAWSQFFGLLLLVTNPTWELQALHLLYISGFGLLTLMISTRVTLSHGGGLLALEKTSRAILWSGIGIMLAAIFRFAAPLLAANYLNLLLISSIFWLLSLLTWFSRFAFYWLREE